MITTKQFQILTDINLVWKLMTEVYDHEESNGPAAPYFEYAITSPWHDRDYDRLDRFWMDGDVPVGFVFYESTADEIHFVLRPGYEALADEMIEYAENAFPKFEDPTELVLGSRQKALIEAAKKRGYQLSYEESDMYFDFRTGTLDYPLPEGYHFTDPLDNDPLKVAKCLWDGFNKAEHGEFKDWEKPTKNGGISPHELYQNVLGATISPAPHATYEYTTVIADEDDNYVCFSGMWWVPENKLAYMEPLCTVPEHQHKGLAAAALAHHEKNLRPLGAEVMTGGGNDFYRRIGYKGVHVQGHYRRTCGTGLVVHYRASSKEMRSNMDYVKENSKIWDDRSANADRWSVPVSSEETALAGKGKWGILLTPTKPVPRDWFPKELTGKDVLCLASGGGQQGPILAAAGANVTVFDNSRTQLEKDILVAERDGLKIKTVQGNMQDLSAFSDESFDLVFHPWSNSYIDNVLPVWKECARVLRRGGILLAGFSNAIECIFDPVKLEQGELNVAYKVPYADVDHLDNPEIKRIAEAEGYIWGHTLTDQIGGQIAAGFAIVGFYEDRGGTALDNYISGSIATKAVKL